MLVSEHFINNNKKNIMQPCSLLELLEAWELETPIKKEWWVIIDLLLAQQADTGEGRSSHATQRAFLSLFQWSSIWCLFPKDQLAPSSLSGPQSMSQTEGATAALLGSWSYSGTFSYSMLPESLPLHPVHTGYNPNPGKRWVGVKLMTPKYAGEMVQW